MNDWLFGPDTEINPENVGRMIEDLLGRDSDSLERLGFHRWVGKWRDRDVRDYDVWFSARKLRLVQDFNQDTSDADYLINRLIALGPKGITALRPGVSVCHP